MGVWKSKKHSVAAVLGGLLLACGVGEVAARERDPDRPWVAGADSLTALGELPKASRVYRDLTLEHPGDASLWMRLAIVELQLDRPGAALEAARTAADLAPDDPDTYLVLAQAEAAAGDRGLGTATLEKGLERHPDWDGVLADLAPYPHYNDMYATAEAVWNTVDHPTVLAAYGMIPGPGIDPQRMRRTLETVMHTWPWKHTWGWDYPMIAMTAARLGEPEIAIEALLLDVAKNTYLPNGHNYQEPERLRIYLPGNGGLLAAVAMMAAGWDGAPEQPAPGFPQDGAWTVQWEGLHPLP